MIALRSDPPLTLRELLYMWQNPDGANISTLKRITQTREVLVDTSAYGLPGEHWCQVTRMAQGTASTYPVKVQIPNRGEGQFKLSEIQKARRRTAR